MSEPSGPTVFGAEVRRLDDRLGLAVCRVPLSGRTLVTYARDHVTVRTPSRPGYLEGNTLDLIVPPAPRALAGWTDRFRETIARLGAPHVQLRWEVPLEADAPAEPPIPGSDLLDAASALRLELSPMRVLLLDRPVDPRTTIDAAPVAAPSAAGGQATDRRWHAASVLYRFEDGDDPDTWSTAGKDATGDIAWRVDVQRELASAGRAQVWVASRHGGPAARLTVFHDRQGLASIADLILHPVHRRRGVASGLVHRAVTNHLADVRADVRGGRIGAAVVPGSAAERVFRRVGFVPHATVWRARRGVRPARASG